MPDAASIEKILQQASSRGWEAMMLAVVIVATGIALGYMFRYTLARSEAREKESSEERARLNKRIDELETLARDRLFDVATAYRSDSASTNATLTKFIEAIQVRPCLWQLQQDELREKRTNKE